MKLLFTAIILTLFSTAAFADNAQKLVAAATEQTATPVKYDSSYTAIPYPNGDVDKSLGVCADVVIRAYRKLGIDLQKLVHEDMKANFALYPKLWGLSAPDTNIDHRRVPNLRVFFTRQGKSFAITDKPTDYKPGDIVSWNLKQHGSLPHIGIVSDKKTDDGTTPLVIHNIGRGVEISDILFTYKITGHYRYE